MTKSDLELAAACKAALDAYVVVAEEARVKGLIASFSITNGGDGNPCGIQQFNVIKNVYTQPAAPANAA